MKFVATNISIKKVRIQITQIEQNFGNFLVMIKLSKQTCSIFVFTTIKNQVSHKNQKHHNPYTIFIVCMCTGEAGVCQDLYHLLLLLVGNLLRYEDCNNALIK